MKKLLTLTILAASLTLSACGQDLKFYKSEMHIFKNKEVVGYVASSTCNTNKINGCTLNQLELSRTISVDLSTEYHCDYNNELSIIQATADGNKVVIKQPNTNCEFNVKEVKK